MSALEYWIGALLLAAVRRAMREHDHFAAPALHYHTVKGGYRSLSFKLNSTAFHTPGRLGLP